MCVTKSNRCWVLCYHLAARKALKTGLWIFDSRVRCKVSLALLPRPRTSPTVFDAVSPLVLPAQYSRISTYELADPHIPPSSSVLHRQTSPKDS